MPPLADLPCIASPAGLLLRVCDNRAGNTLMMVAAAIAPIMAIAAFVVRGSRDLSQIHQRISVSPDPVAGC
jgi:hypothetical protein